MGTMASQITSLTIVYSTVYSGADQRKHQSFASLAFVRGNHQWPVNSPHKWSVTRKMFPFVDVIMREVLKCHIYVRYCPSKFINVSKLHISSYSVCKNTVILKDIYSLMVCRKIARILGIYTNVSTTIHVLQYKLLFRSEIYHRGFENIITAYFNCSWHKHTQIMSSIFPNVICHRTEPW